MHAIVYLLILDSLTVVAAPDPGWSRECLSAAGVRVSCIHAGADPSCPPMEAVLRFLHICDSAGRSVGGGSPAGGCSPVGGNSPDGGYSPSSTTNAVWEGGSAAESRGGGGPARILVHCWAGPGPGAVLVALWLIAARRLAAREAAGLLRVLWPGVCSATPSRPARPKRLQ